MSDQPAAVASADGAEAVNEPVKKKKKKKRTAAEAELLDGAEPLPIETGETFNNACHQMELGPVLFVNLWYSLTELKLIVLPQ